MLNLCILFLFLSILLFFLALLLHGLQVFSSAFSLLRLCFPPLFMWHCGMLTCTIWALRLPVGALSGRARALCNERFMALWWLLFVENTLFSWGSDWEFKKKQNCFVASQHQPKRSTKTPSRVQTVRLISASFCFCVEVPSRFSLKNLILSFVICSYYCIYILILS